MSKPTIEIHSQADIYLRGCQSCRWCPVGPGEWKVESDEGTYFVCEKHKREHGL